jgi:hypothetical protein
VHCLAIARGSWEGRDVAVGGDGPGEDTSGGVKQVYGFVGAWSRLRSMFLDYAAGVFKAQYEGLDWRRCHVEIIAEVFPLPVAL